MIRGDTLVCYEETAPHIQAENIISTSVLPLKSCTFHKATVTHPQAPEIQIRVIATSKAELEFGIGFTSKSEAAEWFEALNLRDERASEVVRFESQGNENVDVSKELTKNGKKSEKKPEPRVDASHRKEVSQALRDSLGAGQCKAGGHLESQVNSFLSALNEAEVSEDQKSQLKRQTEQILKTVGTITRKVEAERGRLSKIMEC